MLQWTMRCWPWDTANEELGKLVKEGWSPAFGPTLLGHDPNGQVVLAFMLCKPDPGQLKLTAEDEKKAAEKAIGMAMR